ncbi:MAG TPA: S8 family serine peptidase [Pyrinomonadaceae bacterium]|nr:S8 family serine peptidase [Pyrinomonadaceae bacterium]
MEEKIGPALNARIQSARNHDTFDVNIFMAGEPSDMINAAADLENPGDTTESIVADTNATSVVGRLKEQAANRQRDVLEYLTGLGSAKNFVDSENMVAVPKVNMVQSFWINNAVGAEVTLDVLKELLARPDVVYIELSQRIDMGDLVDEQKQPSIVGTSDKKHNGVAGSIHAEAPNNGKGSGVPAAFDVLNYLKEGNTFTAFADDVLDDTTRSTWSVKRVGAPLLWQLGLNGDGVLVAVIDTGVNYEHPDLRNRMWDGGEEFPNHGFDFGKVEGHDDNIPLDEGEQAGHGTACAGIIAGDGTSGVRTGVAPGARIMALRVEEEDRRFWRAFEFAMCHHVHVISMSLTWKASKSQNYIGWRRLCESVLKEGILHANSVGNNGAYSTDGVYGIPFNIGAPANCPPPRLHPLQPTPVGNGPHLSSVISCGATDEADRLRNNSGRSPCAWESGLYTDFPFSNGTLPGLIKPDICAPGSSTDSCNWLFNGTAGKPYISFTDTSSAAPHLAGCMALLAQACLRSNNPIVPWRVQEALENTAIQIEGQQAKKEINFGAGRVDVFEAFNYGKEKGWWE